MITRNLEVCPKCGQYDPWRKYSTRVVRGQRRVYVKCKRCGRREVIVYQPRSKTKGLFIGHGRAMENSANGTPSGERSPSG